MTGTDRRTLQDFYKFCGWKELLTAVNSIDDLRDKALFAATFETGGRAGEVLSLRKNQFIKYPKVTMVRDMLVEKQRNPKRMHRTFPILNKDALMYPLWDYLDTLEDDEPLFKFKYMAYYKRLCAVQSKGSKANLAANMWLRWKGPWWGHRLRAERATQMVVENRAGIFELMKWFGWARVDMPQRYIELTGGDLIKMIYRGEL